MSLSFLSLYFLHSRLVQKRYKKDKNVYKKDMMYLLYLFPIYPIFCTFSHDVSFIMYFCSFQGRGAKGTVIHGCETNMYYQSKIIWMIRCPFQPFTFCSFLGEGLVLGQKRSKGHQSNWCPFCQSFTIDVLFCQSFTNLITGSSINKWQSISLANP